MRPRSLASARNSENSRDAHAHAFRLASRLPVVDETQGRKLGSKADRLSLTPTKWEARASRFGTSNLEPAREDLQSKP